MAKEIFTTDRAMEFFSETELSKQMGTSQERWILTVSKELMELI